jgi:two-component system NtrC family sensor kinase
MTSQTSSDLPTVAGVKASSALDKASLLHQVTYALHQSLDESEVCQAIVQQFCFALEADCAGLILYNLKVQTLAVVAAYCRIDAQRLGLDAPVGLTLRLGKSLEQNAWWRHHQPWVAQDVETAAMPEVERLLLQTAGLHSTLMVPIIHAGAVLGIVYLSQQTSCRLWTEGEMQLAALLAEHAAIALHHARRYGEAQRQAQIEQLFNRIQERIRTSLDIDTTLNTALSELLPLTHADRLGFGVPESNSSTSFRITHQVEKREAKENQASEEVLLAPLAPCLLPALSSQELTVIDNTQSFELDESSRAIFQQQQIGALLKAPVWYQQTFLGNLLALKQEPYLWTENETAAMEAVANQLAIAITQAQLYQQTQQQAETAKAQAQQMSQTLHELSYTQAQLVQSEKMSSLGQLVAGIAHEINNPINFIYGNIPYLANYATDILELIRQYQNYYPHPPAVLKELASQIDLEFIQYDLLKILESMQTGTERVRSIVLTLRNFSRLDEAEKKSVDIHEGIESTLVLLEHRLKLHNIEVIRQYSQLPLVECYPGQLNQVLMNLLTNAIDALEVSSQDTQLGAADPLPACIQIRTQLLNSHWVQIGIKDTGRGIPPEHESKVFDPFFTTKPVGMGTGLGLTIAYKIVVQKHQGKFWFQSLPDRGTEFMIELPLP